MRKRAEARLAELVRQLRREDAAREITSTLERMSAQLDGNTSPAVAARRRRYEAAVELVGEARMV